MHRLHTLLGNRAWLATLLLLALPLGAVYVVQAFTNPNAGVRIVLRTGPVLPLAVWTLYFDAARPLEGASPLLRAAGRLVLLVGSMAFAALLLGFGIDRLYELRRAP